MKRILVFATTLAVLLVMTVRTDAGISISISFTPSGPRQFDSWRPHPVAPRPVRRTVPVVVHHRAPVVVHQPPTVVVYRPAPVVVYRTAPVVVYRRPPVVVYRRAPVVVRRRGVNVHGRWRYTRMRTRHGVPRYRRIFVHR